MKHIYMFLLPVAELIPESFDSSFVPIMQFQVLNFHHLVLLDAIRVLLTAVKEVF